MILMYDKLIKRLRHDAKAIFGYINEDLLKAADAIEELQKDLERSKDFEAFWQHAAEETLKKFQVAISNKPRWISVTEQLPEENGHYLVYAVGNGYCSTYIALWNGRFRANFEMPITHWMSLPQPPKSEGE